MSFADTVRIFEVCAEDWDAAIKHGNIYGFAASQRLLYDSGIDGLHYKAIFDNNSALWGTQFNDVPVLNPEQVQKINGKILVLSLSAYDEISKQLKRYGLKEFEDFWEYGAFLSAYHWWKSAHVFTCFLHLAITTRCTLRCDSCSFFMLDHRVVADMSLADWRESLKLTFSLFDFVQDFRLLGGEPLLHRQLPEFLEALSPYTAQIGRINLITNGTIIPPQEVLSLCHKFDIGFYISNYSAAGTPNYVEKLNKIIALLKENTIRVLLQDKKWYKIRCDSDDLVRLGMEELQAHYSRCTHNAECKAISCKKFYNCQVAWAWSLIDDLPEPDDNFLDMSKLDPTNPDDKFKLLANYHGDCPNGYLSYCDRCYGLDPHYRYVIPTAVQRPKKS